MKLFFRYFFRTVRLILGPFMLLGEQVMSPRRMERSEAVQKEVDEACSKLLIYQYRTCPFCIKVRREMARLSLNIEKRDALKDPAARAELEAGGGQIKVPCLCITDDSGKQQWMYESDDIIAYLRDRFAQ